MLKLVPFDFIQPSKLLAHLDPYDYVAVSETGVVLGRGRVKELVLDTPGIFGYFNLREAYPLGNYPKVKMEAAKPAQTPSFDEAPWGSLGDVQAVPGWPLIETLKIDRPDLVEQFIEDGPRRMNEAADKAMKLMKRDPLDHDGDGKKGGSLKGAKRKKKAVN